MAGRKRRSFNRRTYNTRFIPQQLKILLGVGLLVLLAVYSYPNLISFDNGSGGADWKIGKPELTFWSSNYPRSLPQLQARAVQLINRDRQLNGLAPVQADPLLMRVAQLHAEDMKARHYYAHVTPEGKTPTDRLSAAGGEGGVGENIMLQTESVGGVAPLLTWGVLESFQKKWMYSPGHRANLLNAKYTKVGYGIVSSLREIYAVQDFQ